MSLPQLRRVRWAVRATLVLGVAASVCANVLHAAHNPISQTIAAWPPLALLLTVELISRIPMHRRYLAAIRVAATSAIAGIAAWVSYWHMAGVAAKYGEEGSVPYLLPISVDGLIIVASVSLVELAGRIRVIESEGAKARAPKAASAAGTASNEATLPGPGPASPGMRVTRVARRRTASAGTAKSRGAAAARPAGANGARADEGQLNGANGARANGAAANGANGVHANGAAASADRPKRRGRPVAETRALAAELAAAQPDATEDDLARQLGISTKRLRTVLASSEA